MERWHQNMLEKLTASLEPNENVLGLLLFGSCSRSQQDAWSDLDVLLLVKKERMHEFFPSTVWLNAFGPLYAFSQSSHEFMSTTRVCFENFERIDFVITTEESLANVDAWPAVPFFSERKILFSRSEVLDRVAGREEFRQKFTPATDERFLDLVRNFRFKSMQAVYKVVRGDLLIAVHLTQDLLRDCCVLGMMSRDRATGTNIHKQGGAGNIFVAQLERAQFPFTPMGILESIQASSELFEKLACEWSNTYQENHLLLNWIEKAKAEISG